jgi:phospholipid transport system substrate-binding protein
MKFKNIIKTLLLITFAVSSANAYTKEQIKPEMTKNINNIITIIKDKDITKDNKGKAIINIIDTAFNYKIMSRVALGKKWKKLSVEQRENFIGIFGTTLKNTYVNKLNLYTDQEIKIGDLTKEKKRLVLKSQLVGDKETFDIDYKFYYDKKTKDWAIYDVKITGISIITTFRKQFAQITFEEAVEQLKEKNK